MVGISEEPTGARVWTCQTAIEQSIERRSSLSGMYMLEPKSCWSDAGCSALCAASHNRISKILEEATTVR